MERSTIVPAVALFGAGVCAAVAFKWLKRSKSSYVRREVTWVNPLPSAESLEDKPAQLIADTHCLVGEGIQWDVERQCLYWVDIEGSKFYELRCDGQLTTYHLHERAGSFAMRENGLGFIFAFESGFALFEPSSGELQPIPTPYQQTHRTRLNDGRCDRQGRFICGAYNSEENDPNGYEKCCGVYRVSGQGAEELLPYKVRSANSICFSLDGKKMYFTDSPSREILEFEYGDKLGNSRVFATNPPSGVPDGSIIDSAGGLWNAQYDMGSVARYHPSGRLDATVDIPASKVTCACLGGRNLDILFVTTAKLGLSDVQKEQQPHAGGVFAVKADIPGVPESRYRW